MGGREGGISTTLATEARKAVWQRWPKRINQWLTPLASPHRRTLQQRAALLGCIEARREAN